MWEVRSGVMLLPPEILTSDSKVTEEEEAVVVIKGDVAFRIMDMAKVMVVEEEEEVLEAMEAGEEHIISVDRTGSCIKIIPK